MIQKKDLFRAMPCSALRLWLTAQLIFWLTILTAVAADALRLRILGIFSRKGGPEALPFVVMIVLFLVSLAVLILAGIELIRTHRSRWAAITALGMIAGTVIATGYAFGFLILVVAGFSGMPH